MTAHLFPATSLSYRQVRPGVVRITQDYRAPRDVQLGGKTLFYVAAARRPRRAAGNRSASTRRVRPGRYRSRVTVTIPDAYGGRFRYAACYRYTPRLGHGRPEDQLPAVGLPLLTRP